MLRLAFVTFHRTAHLFVVSLALGYVGTDFLPLDAALGDRDGGALLNADELALLLRLARAYPLHHRVALFPEKQTGGLEQGLSNLFWRLSMLYDLCSRVMLQHVASLTSVKFVY